jgi:hypothetical protein
MASESIESEGIRPGSFGNIPCLLFVKLIPSSPGDPSDGAASLEKWEGGAQFKTKNQFHDAIGKKGPAIIDADWDFWRMTGEACVKWHNEETLEILFEGVGKLQFYPAGVEEGFPNWCASRRKYFLSSNN